MSELPEYLNCKNEKIEHCGFYMRKECPETCAYAHNIRGLGVGAVCDVQFLKKLEDINNGS